MEDGQVAIADANSGKIDVLSRIRLGAGADVVDRCDSDLVVQPRHGEEGIQIWAIEEQICKFVLSTESHQSVDSFFRADRFLCGKCERGILVWDLEAGQLLHNWHAAKKDAAEIHGFTADEKKVICQLDENSVQLTDLASGQISRRIQIDNDPYCQVEWFPKTESLVFGLKSGDIEIWDLPKGKLVKFLKGHRSRVNQILETENSEQIISTGSDGEIRLWDLSKAAAFEGHSTKQVTGEKPQLISPRLAWTHGDQRIDFWDLDRAKLRATWRLDHYISPEKIFTAGRFLVVPNWEKTSFWDCESMSETKTLELKERPLEIFPVPGDRIGVALKEGIRIWDPAQSNWAPALSEQNGELTAVALYREDLAVTVDSAGRILEWNIESGEVNREILTTETPPQTMLALDDGFLVGNLSEIGDTRTLLSFWNLDSGEQLRPPVEMVTGLSRAYLFKMNSSHFASYVHPNPAVTIWTGDGREVARLERENRPTSIGKVQSPADGEITIETEKGVPEHWDYTTGTLKSEGKPFTTTTESGEILEILDSPAGLAWFAKGDNGSANRMRAFFPGISPNQIVQGKNCLLVADKGSPVKMLRPILQTKSSEKTKPAKVHISSLVPEDLPQVEEITGMLDSPAGSILLSQLDQSPDPGLAMLAGICLRRSGKIDEAKNLLLGALEKEFEPGSETEASICIELAGIASDEGKLEEAVSPLQRAVAVSELHENPQLKQQIQVSLFEVHRSLFAADRGRKDDALEAIEISREIEDSLFNDGEKENALLFASQRYFLLLGLEDQAAMVKEGLACGERYGDPTLILGSRREEWLAEDESTETALPAASDPYLKQLRENRDETDMAALQQEARLLEESGAHDEELEVYRIMEKLARENEDWKEVARTCSNQGLLEMRLGRFPEAEEKLTQAVENAQKCDDSFLTAHSIIVLGQTVSRMGDRPEVALKHANEAAEWAKKAGDTRILVQSLVLRMNSESQCGIDLEERLPVLEELRQLFFEADLAELDAPGETPGGAATLFLSALAARIRILGVLGRDEEAISAASELEKLARKHDDAKQTGFALAAQAEMTANRGEISEAILEQAKEAKRILEKANEDQLAEQTGQLVDAISSNLAQENGPLQPASTPVADKDFATWLASQKDMLETARGAFAKGRKGTPPDELKRMISPIMSADLSGFQSHLGSLLSTFFIGPGEGKVAKPYWCRDCRMITVLALPQEMDLAIQCGGCGEDFADPGFLHFNPDVGEEIFRLAERHARCLELMNLGQETKGEECHQAFIEAIDIAEELENRWIQAILWRLRGEAFREEGKPDQAKEFFLKAEEGSRREGDCAEAAKAIVEMGKFYGNQLQQHLAMVYCDRAIDLASTKPNSKQGMLSLFIAMGEKIEYLGRQSETVPEAHNLTLRLVEFATQVDAVFETKHFSSVAANLLAEMEAKQTGDCEEASALENALEAAGISAGKNVRMISGTEMDILRQVLEQKKSGQDVDAGAIMKQLGNMDSRLEEEFETHRDLAQKSAEKNQISEAADHAFAAFNAAMKLGKYSDAIQIGIKAADYSSAEKLFMNVREVGRGIESIGCQNGAFQIYTLGIYFQAKASREEGNFQEAFQIFQTGLVAPESWLNSEEPETPFDVLKVFLSELRNTGYGLADSGRQELAADAYREAVSLGGLFMGKFPDDFAHSAAVAGDWDELGITLLALGKPDEGKEALKKSLEIMVELDKLDPKGKKARAPHRKETEKRIKSLG